MSMQATPHDNVTEGSDAAPRRMTRVLMRLTVILTVSLGVAAGVFQMLVDLKQEKDAVEINAAELVETLAPTAANAVYNFDENGANQVAAGLFTQRAVGRVVIWESDAVYAEANRDLVPTLPNFGMATSRDVIVLTHDLYNPAAANSGEIIGRIEVTIDRSIVPPAIVDRMFLYFVIAVLKNSLLGALLIIVVFRGLARHVVRLARAVEKWTPDAGSITKPEPPRYLHDTELDTLGVKIERMSTSASDALRALEASNARINQTNSQLQHQSEDLSSALHERNERLRVLNQELTELANKDGLTAQHNRRHFEHRAGEILRKSERSNNNFVVLLIDIDHFKAFNDFYGHQRGDDCLREVADALGRLTHDLSGLFARYGGEEFIALIEDVAPGDVEAVAQSFVDCVSALGVEHARSLTARTVSVSVGVACRAHTGCVMLEELVGAADRALYAAKSAGRGRAVHASRDFVSAVRRDEQATQEILGAIRVRAFEPFFQPQVDARTGEIVGLEALARWRRGAGEHLGPIAFLPKAAELGLDADIDAIIQEKALQRLSAWRREGIAPGRLSMNLSENRLLAGEITGLLQRFPDVNDEGLAFELLESTFIEQQSSAFEEQLQAVRAQGVAIEIDDFGTGHTSLVGLAAIAPERIKLARELVAPLGGDPRATKVVEAVVEIAQAFDIDLIAEGVETAAQAQQLIDLGCPIQQGFHHARPMPAGDVDALLRSAASPAAASA